MPKVSRIRVLPEALANQIAAGEEVQRPASALKELVENSLDAGARRIQVDQEGGGAQCIRVRDDGEGMGRDDALLAFERHATSKIASAEDLHRVATLGFRGEALPSIAAVSRVTLTTRRAGEALGTEVVIEGGQVRRVTEMGAPEGTQLEARALFFNVPARRKFLRRPETELARCVEVVSRAAMAHPEAAFTLRHGGKVLLDLRAGEERLARAASLLGKDSAPHLLEVSAEGERERLGGWAAAPSLTRSGRDGQYLFVNGRPVREPVLVRAAYEAYRSFLPGGRHPLFVLFLDLPPEEVDVNVHPSKEEVRFRRASAVYALVREALMAALGAPAPRSRLAYRRPPAPLPAGRLGETTPWRGRPAPPSLLGGGGYVPPRAPAEAPSEPEEAAPLVYEAEPGFAASPVLPPGVAEKNLPVFPASALPGPLERVLQPPHPSRPVRLAECRYLGQWEECFLLFASPQGLVFMDQHAAHERVLYNRFRDQFREGKVETQACLVPAGIRLRPEEAIRLEARRGALERSGFDLEPAGPGEYLIRSVPALLAERDPAGAVRRVVEGLAEWEEPMSFPDLIDGIIARMSCRGAVKAAQALHPEEVAALAAEVDRTPGSWTCPHGRPLILVLGAGPVRRRFLRS
ncbi:MAG: DNA mismatch repair endonuclease MutL [Candidatus Tectomicrobia bacterium]|uniref:DNA mismatch repair protein MutL n=1 Tax=Tectimicrobiota bacterium TaxID=2528274 RepID=A0A933E7M0_UNCTE|nr:DNA mismatch repair endonuclease MutL [Candidatus Tectomicrobia bacterium]